MCESFGVGVALLLSTFGAREWIDIASTLATLILAVVAVATLRESRRMADAAHDQAAASREQAASSHQEAEASRHQAEIATRALELQLAPRLTPGEEETFEVGEVEDVGGEIQRLLVLPVRVGIRNVGNGLALIDDLKARGTAPLQDPTVIKPAVIPSGGLATVRLDFGGGFDQLHSGDRFSVFIRYSGPDRIQRDLAFNVQYFHHGRWRIEIDDDRELGSTRS